MPVLFSELKGEGEEKRVFEYYVQHTEKCLEY